MKQEGWEAERSGVGRVDRLEKCERAGGFRVGGGSKKGWDVERGRRGRLS